MTSNTVGCWFMTGPTAVAVQTVNVKMNKNCISWRISIMMMMQVKWFFISAVASSRQLTMHQKVWIQVATRVLCVATFKILLASKMQIRIQ